MVRHGGRCGGLLLRHGSRMEHLSACLGIRSPLPCQVLQSACSSNLIAKKTSSRILPPSRTTTLHFRPPLLILQTNQIPNPSPSCLNAQGNVDLGKRLEVTERVVAHLLRLIVPRLRLKADCAYSAALKAIRRSKLRLHYQALHSPGCD